MPTYAAFLGHQPHISLAELAVLLPDFRPKRQWDLRIVTFETDAILDTEWLSMLGGTVLIAEEIPLPPADSKKHSLDDIVPKMLHKSLKDIKRKATFSFRCLNVPRNDIRSLYRVCKKYLKDKNLPSRYIGNERHPAKPGTLLLRGIPGPGSAEIVILRDRDGKNLWIGKTCAVQDIEAYTARDVGKPFRDRETGLLPPKLAQVLLNLSLVTLPERKEVLNAKKGAISFAGMTVWDPFCGSGVVILEALLRRANAIGSDKTEKAVRGCAENVKWLRLREKTPKSILHFILKQNACKPFDLPKSPTMIVTETTLGPALKKPPTKQEIQSLIREAEELECEFFTMLANHLPEIPVVCTFPVYIGRDGSKNYLEKTLKIIEKLGYRKVSLANTFLKPSDRQSLLYLRPDQMVGREIFCFLPPVKKDR